MQQASSLLRAISIRKSFGATRALENCSFDLRGGEVHAIVGENGSGKSTLVKVLGGVHRPDGGCLEVNGLNRRGFRSPRESLDNGVAVVFQEALVVESSSVLENLWLGTDRVFREGISRHEKTRRGSDVFAELTGRTPDLEMAAADLSLSERQLCSIARAMLRGPRVLVLDEATSTLDVGSRDRVFSALHRLRADGVGIIFISHRMDEIEHIADRVTVFRSGVDVATLDQSEAVTATLVKHMTGSGRLTTPSKGDSDRPAVVKGPCVLRTDALILREGGQPIDFELFAGELVGLAGLEGHGQEAFLNSLWGQGKRGGRVLRVMPEGEAAIDSPEDGVRKGVVYVPRDRRRESMFPTMSILENFTVATLGNDRRQGLLSRRSSVERLRALVQQLNIKLSRHDDAITTLSGGNQQKVFVARWLAAKPAVLLLNDPTRGVDLNAKRDLYTLMRRLVGEGAAVVMLSTEVDEHIELMNRVIVFREGQIAAQLPSASLSRTTLVSAFFGQTADINA